MNSEIDFGVNVTFDQSISWNGKILVPKVNLYAMGVSKDN